ncbi:hypothetical protein [Salana multivorans]
MAYHIAAHQMLEFDLNVTFRWAKKLMTWAMRIVICTADRSSTSVDPAKHTRETRAEPE